MSDFDVQIPASFDSFAEANAEDSDAGSKEYVHTRIQQRNGRKSLTTVQGLKKESSYNKIHELTMHPICTDPLLLQYFQQTVHDPYGVPVQYSGHLPSPGIISNQVDSFALRNDLTTTAYLGDQKFQIPLSSSVSIPSAKKMEVPSNSYLSSPTGLGFVPKFPAAPLNSPIPPESPVGGDSLGRRYDFGFSQSSPRNVGSYSRWKGQKGSGGVNEHRKHSHL